MSNPDQNQLGLATAPAASQAVEMLERVAADADSIAAPASANRNSSLPIPERTLPFGFSAIPFAARQVPPKMNSGTSAS